MYIFISYRGLESNLRVVGVSVLLLVLIQNGEMLNAEVRE